MKTELEALELAREALSHTATELGHPNFEVEGDALFVIYLVLERLAQPEQEPFGWYSAQEDEFMTHKLRKEHERLNSYTHKVGKFDLALYTTSPQRKEPEQEPVAVVDANDDGYWADILPDRSVIVGQLLYTTPPQRKPLTDEAALNTLDAAGVAMHERVTCAYELQIFRAAEAAHGIKE